MNLSLPSRLSLAVAFATLGTTVARAEPNTDGRQMLGICQRVLGEDSSTCVSKTAFSITKTIDDDLLEQPNRQAVAYIVRVVEGSTRYALSMTSLVTLTGLVEDGTTVRGIVTSLRKRSPGQEGFTTVASALVGNADPACGCPFVGSADLDVTLRDENGAVVPAGVDNLIESLGYGEDMVLQLDATYDLAAGIVLPGDEVMLQACVQWSSNADADRPGCFEVGGGTRAVRACSAFDFTSYASPKSAVVDVTELLQPPEVSWIDLNGFRALSQSATVTPRGAPVTILPGVGKLFQIAATGLPGTESVIAITGDVSCGQHVTCEPGASLCFADLWNDATLDFHDERGSITASAGTQVVCRPFQCLPGDILACDDGDPCTIDGCTPNVGCTHTPHAGACDDGNPCTTGETCATGTCQGGSATVCGGATACVDAWCDATLGCQTQAKPNRTKCDDQNACTVDDECLDGTCKAGAPRDCNDNNVCTNDSCSAASGCSNVAAPNGGTCSDNNVCTTGDQCVGGVCTGGPALGCDDGNPCTIDRCDPSVAGGCVHDPAPSTTACDDGDACTVSDKCQAGTCKAGTPRVCSDSNACTNDLCNAQTGCYFPPRTGSCDDGTVCSTASMCLDGQCAATAMLDCDDGNPCTADTCHPTNGCQHAPLANGVTCDDHNPCSANDSCQSGVCASSTVTVCDDNNDCTNSTCLPDVGCVHIARSGACQDGNACTSGDQCDAGQCRPGPSTDCDDHNPCTVDSCSPATGCAHAPINAGGCDDGDPCTAPGVCQAGQCAQQTPVVCDDHNPCTADRCDAGVGCVAPPIGGSCDDGDACTGDGVCQGGVCKPGAALDCNDNNACTLDVCRAGSGCDHLARDQVPCDDQNPCTTGDMCRAGVCQGSAALDCDDRNPCTDDLCTPSGCMNLVRTGACEDGNLCTVGDTCVSGQCVSGAPKSCGDDNTCTSDQCNVATGQCSHPVLVDGTTCSDDDVCTGCVWPEPQVLRGWHLLDAVPDPAFFASSPGTGTLDLNGFQNGQRVLMTATPELRFVQVSSQLAYLRGNLTAGTTTWRIEIPLTWRGEGANGQGASPFRELPLGNQTTVWTDHWKYWLPSTTAELVSVTTGERVALASDPTFGQLPLQMGMRANGRNLLDGLSWPLRWTRSGQSGTGVLRATLDREYCQVADQCSAGECDGGSDVTTCLTLVPGEYCSYDDSDLGAVCKPGQEQQIQCVLQANFAKIATERPVCSSQLVYAFGFSSGSGSSYRRYAFNSATAIANFLPTASPFSSSPVDLCNPVASTGNRFVSRAMALDLSIVLSDVGVLPAPHGVAFGDLRLTTGDCSGYSLRELAHRAEMVAVGVRPPGVSCWDATSIESVVQAVVVGFRNCQTVMPGVRYPD